MVSNATAVSSGIRDSTRLAIDVDVVCEASDIDAHANRRGPGKRRQRRRGAGSAIAERLLHAADAPPYEIDADASRRRVGVHLRAVAELHVHGVSGVGAGLGPVELERPVEVPRGNFGETVRHERPHHGFGSVGEAEASSIEHDGGAGCFDFGPTVADGRARRAAERVREQNRGLADGDRDGSGGAVARSVARGISELIRSGIACSRRVTERRR